MLGYCSNSPKRCHHAYSLEVLDRIDACCPDCGLALIPVQNLGRQLRIDIKVLQIIFLVLSIILLLLVYIYY